MTIKELREKRARLVAQARGILDAAERVGRQPNAEERRQFNAMMADVDTMGADIDRLAKLEALEEAQRASQGRQVAPEQPGGRSTEERRAAFATYLASGQHALTDNEQRSLVAGHDPAGGYLMAPQQMAAELVKGLDNALLIRQLATKLSLTTAESLGVPTLDTDLDDATWTTELATGDEDTSLAIGKRALKPHPMAKRVKVSNTLLRRATMGAEAIVRDRLGYKFAATEEKGFMLGDGIDKPLGLFTASANGISTARDVKGDNTTTAIVADALIDAKYALKEAYQRSPTTRWIFHRDAVKMIRKLKSATDGQYLWKPGLASDQPDTILDIPIVMSEYAPNTFTSGQYVGLLGDLRYYWIVDGLQLQVQRLAELYAETNETGFIGRLECDGMPVLEEAFARVQLA